MLELSQQAEPDPPLSKPESVHSLRNRMHQVQLCLSLAEHYLEQGEVALAAAMFDKELCRIVCTRQVHAQDPSAGASAAHGS